MRYGNLAFAVASTLIVAGCVQQQGAVYQRPIGEAKRMLARTDIPPLVFGTIPPASRTTTEGASDVVWIVSKKGAEVFRFVATLSDAGHGATRVQLKIKGVTSGPSGNVEQSLSDHATIKKLYLTAMTERIASALEQRPFDLARIYPALGIATLANMNAIVAQFDRASEQYKRSSRANIEKAYRDEARGIDY